MNRIFEKLYAVKWLELLKVSAECQLFSNCDSSFVKSPVVCVSKRFCRRLAKDKLESGPKSKVEPSPQVTWRAMLKRNEVKPKKKHKKEVSKKTQSEFSIRESVKTTVKTRSNPQIPLKPKNESLLSKLPKYIKGSNFADDGLQKTEIITKPETTPEILAPKIASVQEEIRKVKFLFVPVERSDIPPPKDLNILTTIQNQIANVPTEIDNKSNLQDYISRPKISIKSLKPLKSLETAAKTFKLNPLNKQNQFKHVQNLFERTKSKPSSAKSPTRVPVPKISDRAREAMKKNQIYDTETMKIVKPVAQNPSVTILKQAKFPDKTPVISTEENKPLMAKSSTFTIETKSIPRPPPPPDLVPLKNVVLSPQDIIPVKPSRSKLPRLVTNKTDETEKKIEEKSLLPQVIEPNANEQSCWKLMNNDVLEPLKKKLASKIPIRNINDHPLLLETGKTRKKVNESVE